jgi:hypothetical protein
MTASARQQSGSLKECKRCKGTLPSRRKRSEPRLRGGESAGRVVPGTLRPLGPWRSRERRPSQQQRWVS